MINKQPTRNMNLALAMCWQYSRPRSAGADRRSCGSEAGRSAATPTCRSGAPWAALRTCLNATLLV